MSESKTLRIHTNQEEEYPAIKREYGVLKNPFTSMYINVCTSMKWCTLYVVRTCKCYSLTVTMLGGE